MPSPKPEKGGFQIASKKMEDLDNKYTSRKHNEKQHMDTPILMEEVTVV